MASSEVDDEESENQSAVQLASIAPRRGGQKRKKQNTCLFRGNEHGQRLTEELDGLRSLQGSGGLVDLDIVCQEKKIRVHKVVMAAASTFFKDQLCRANVLLPAILRLEDFGHELTSNAVKAIVEYTYRGEVLIESEEFMDVAKAAHTLGVHGLKDFLPDLTAASSRPSPSKRAKNDDDKQTVTAADSSTEKEPEPIDDSTPLPSENSCDVRAEVSDKSEQEKTSKTSEQPPTAAQSVSKSLSKGKLRVIHQQGTITHSTPNIQSKNYNLMDDQVVVPSTSVASEPVNACNAPPPAPPPPPPQPPSSCQYENYQFCQQDSSHHEVMIIEEEDDNIAICDQNYYQAETGTGFAYDPQIFQPPHPPPPPPPQSSQPPTAANPTTNGAPAAAGYASPWIPAPPPLSQQAPIYQYDMETGHHSGHHQQHWQHGHQRRMKKKEEDLEQDFVSGFVSQNHEIEEIGSGSWINASAANPDDPSHRAGPGPEVQCGLEEFNDHTLSSCATPAGWSWTIPADNSLPPTDHSSSSWNIAHSGNSSAINTPSKSPIALPGGDKTNTLDQTTAASTATPATSQESGVQSWHMLAEAAAVLSSSTAILSSESNSESPPLEVVFSSSSGSCAQLSQQETAVPPQQQQNSAGGLPLLAGVAQVASGNEALKSPKRAKGEGLEVRKDLQIGSLNIANDNISVAATNVESSASDAPSLPAAKQIVHPCKECDITFSSPSQRKQHIRHAHRKIGVFACPICQISDLVGKENLKLHMYKSHGIGEIYRCEVCNFETSSKAVFTRHEASAHIEDEEESVANNSTSPKKPLQFKCSVCNKTFRSRVGLKQHLQQHNDMGLHKCMVCSFKTPQHRNLVKHLATKHKKDAEGEDLKESRECSHCDFKCVADHQLKAHILRKHTAKSDMKFKCNCCPYATVEKSALEKHVRFKHTKERPFMCDICGFSTHTKSAMARHSMSHTGAKPHVCEECGNAYADRKRLKDHMLAHSGSLPFVCDFCGFSCRRKDNLQAHVRRVHPELNLDPLERAMQSVSSPPETAKSGGSNKTRTVSGSPSKSKNKSDRSHIVGHINHDGSIRPVTAVPPAPPVGDAAVDIESLVVSDEQNSV